MNIMTYWVPRSARGREVGRLLKKLGIVSNVHDALGRYLCNIPGTEDLLWYHRRMLAYILDPRRAEAEEEQAWQEAERLYPQDPKAEQAARRGWLK